MTPPEHAPYWRLPDGYGQSSVDADQIPVITKQLVDEAYERGVRHRRELAEAQR